MPDILTRPALAKLLHCNGRTLARAERRGELISHKLNARTIIYRKENILAWLIGSCSDQETIIEPGVLSKLKHE